MSSTPEHDSKNLLLMAENDLLRERIRQQGAELTRALERETQLRKEEHILRVLVAVEHTRQRPLH